MATTKAKAVREADNTEPTTTWAKELGCSRQIVRYRLEAGWTIKQIIETKIDYKNRINK
jgi:hypothetical protein